MIILDTGVLVAAINRRDRHHAACAQLLNQAKEPLIMPALAITEVCYLVARPPHGYPQLAAAFLGDLTDPGIAVDSPCPADFIRMSELIQRYSNLPLDAVDASVIATAERLNISRIATVDRRDFRIVVSALGRPFELLPEGIDAR